MIKPDVKSIVEQQKFHQKIQNELTTGIASKVGH
jgi:hypothetical protein